MPDFVPEVNGTPTRVLVTFRYVDANGTKDSFSIISTLARATDAVIEAAVEALGDASNANFYEVNKQLIYSAGNASPSGAIEAPRESAKTLWKSFTKTPPAQKLSTSTFQRLLMQCSSPPQTTLTLPIRCLPLLRPHSICFCLLPTTRFLCALLNTSSRQKRQTCNGL